MSGAGEKHFVRRGTQNGRVLVYGGGEIRF